jgi:hypothetical protein
MMEKRIIEAFQMAPAVVELDQPGYADPQELMALQKVRMDFRTKCQDIALRYLKEHDSPVAAKAAASADVQRVRTGTTPDDPDFDLSPYFDVVHSELNEAIDRESRKSALLRNATRAVLAVPTLFRVAALALVAFMLVMAARDLIFK